MFRWHGSAGMVPLAWLHSSRRTGQRLERLLADDRHLTGKITMCGDIFCQPTYVVHFHQLKVRGDWQLNRPHVVEGMLRGEVIRYAITNTRAEELTRVRRLFLHRLLDTGYPSVWAV